MAIRSVGKFSPLDFPGNDTQRKQVPTGSAQGSSGDGGDLSAGQSDQAPGNIQVPGEKVRCCPICI